MADEPIARAEYEEYKKRLDEENKRQDKRIELLEESTKQINAHRALKAWLRSRKHRVNALYH